MKVKSRKRRVLSRKKRAHGQPDVSQSRISRAPKQLDLIGKENSFYGGSLRTTRRSRQTRRPLAVKKSMHVVLRSSKAKGPNSFRSARNANKITELLKKHAAKNHVKIFSFANVGNHIHLHIQLSYREGYTRFIRAITAAIAMYVMNWNKWTRADREAEAKGHREAAAKAMGPQEEKVASKEGPEDSKRFWDFRPYTNVVTSWTGFLQLKDYVQINQFEACGLPRSMATLIVKNINPFAGPTG